MWLLRGIIGLALCAVGTVWILQGTSVIHGSGMSGHGQWGVIGAVVVVVGLFTLILAARRFLKGAGVDPGPPSSNPG
ncbi:MAG TPA: hypothetical protein VG298_17330 [Acidimicrobiales bacterium]|jgi:hypothetical protein|nr:hypothetical protein [Acidimicrobiales bacterium]